jgi:hypothetical protein
MTPERSAMKLIPVFAAAALAATGLAFALVAPRGGGPEVGKPAPEINAKTWLNHLGTDPSLANLRGQAVLLEFWATW